MDIDEHIQHTKKIYNHLLSYIENENDDIEDFKSLCQTIEELNIQNDHEKYENFLILLSKMSKNHYRSTYFFKKIERVINYLDQSIKQTFSNIELFNIFKKNKRVLLFLFEKKNIMIDEKIYDLILKKSDADYFYPEIQPFLQNDTIKQKLLNIDSDIFSQFEEKRKIGENDSYICELIRNDSIEEFVQYVNRNNYSLLNKVQPSIFETNPILIKYKEQTLIEYAAFFGAIQIFQYLRLNNISLTSSLWIYAIHGKNGEIIHLLEEDNIKPDDSSYMKCFEIATKCHHNEIANYFKINYVSDEKECEKKDFCYRYYNYELFPESIIFDFFSFCCFCEYNYMTIVKLFFENEEKTDFISNSKI